MTSNLFYLIPAIALLWMPRQMLRFKRPFSKRNKFTNPRATREPGDNALRAGEEFSKLRNYIDVLRAMAGSYGVMQFGLFLPADASPEARMALLSVKSAILVIAILVQTMRWDGKLLLFAPSFFLAGLAAGVSGMESAIYGTAVAWVINAILPSPSAFLVAQGLLIGAFGAFFHGPTDPLVVVGGILTMIPSIIGFMIRRPLAIGSRHPFRT